MGICIVGGHNVCGETGNGTKKIQKTPVKVLEDVTFVDETGAITEDGSLYCWGANGWGQAGIGTRKHQLSPVKIILNDSSSSKITLSRINNVKTTAKTIM